MGISEISLFCQRSLFNVDIAVSVKACSGRNKFSDDNVFFETKQMVALSLNCRIGQNLRRFLE